MELFEKSSPHHFRCATSHNDKAKRKPSLVRAQKQTTNPALQRGEWDSSQLSVQGDMRGQPHSPKLIQNCCCLSLNQNSALNSLPCRQRMFISIILWVFLLVLFRSPRVLVPSKCSKDNPCLQSPWLQQGDPGLSCLVI